MIIPAMRKTYKGVTVLDIPGIEVRDGSIIALCGQNGSGKSTLAKIIAGIVRPDERITGLDSLKVGYMNQLSTAFTMSVRKNLLLNADRGRSRLDNINRAEDLMKAAGLSEYASKNAKRLSGGQIQRMALIRILMKDYDLLILDEPTASMDRDAVPAAEALIRDYRERTGSTVILITHSREQAERNAERIITLEYGKIKNIEDPGR